MSRYSSIVGFPYAAGIGPYNFDSFTASVTVINENNAPNPTVNIVVQTHGIKTTYPLYWSTETVPGSATISAGHFTDNTLTGSFNVDESGSATITRTARADSTTNGSRVFKIVIRLGNPINGGVMTKSVEITMNDTSLTPLTATKNPAIAGVGYLIVGVINLPMNQLVVSQTTGGLGRNYNFTNTPVPAGLRIDSTTNGTATLAGTPTVTSLTPTSYTVTANQTPDIPNQTATPSTVTYSLAIASTLTSVYNDVPQGTTRWLPPNTIITSFIPIQASGGWTPYKYTLTNSTLPSGLSYSETTGTITGSNGATNLLTFNVNIEDSSNAPKQPTTSKQFNMRVATVKATTVDLDNRIFVRGIPISPFRPITYTSTAPAPGRYWPDRE